MSILQPRKYTYDEFLEIAKGEKRVEFINGDIYYLATPTLEHQRITGRIYSKLLNYFEGLDGECEAFIAPFDIIFEQDKTIERVQPDIFVLCGDKPANENHFKGVPAFVIEVLSPSNSSHDYVKKMDLYARFGVKEYWIVSPANKVIEKFVYTEEERAYAEPIIYFKDSIIQSSIFEGLSIELKEIFK